MKFSTCMHKENGGKSKGYLTLKDAMRNPRTETNTKIPTNTNDICCDHNATSMSKSPNLRARPRTECEYVQWFEAAFVL